MYSLDHIYKIVSSVWLIIVSYICYFTIEISTCLWHFFSLLFDMYAYIGILYIKKTFLFKNTNMESDSVHFHCYVSVKLDIFIKKKKLETNLFPKLNSEKKTISSILVINDLHICLLNSACFIYNYISELWFNCSWKINGGSRAYFDFGLKFEQIFFPQQILYNITSRISKTLW